MYNWFEKIKDRFSYRKQSGRTSKARKSSTLSTENNHLSTSSQKADNTQQKRENMKNLLFAARLNTFLQLQKDFLVIGKHDTMVCKDGCLKAISYSHWRIFIWLTENLCRSNLS